MRVTREQLDKILEAHSAHTAADHLIDLSENVAFGVRAEFRTAQSQDSDKWQFVIGLTVSPSGYVSNETGKRL